MAIPYGLFKFQVTPEGTAHEVMDPPLIAHCVTVLSSIFGYVGDVVRDGDSVMNGSSSR